MPQPQTPTTQQFDHADVLTDQFVAAIADLMEGYLEEHQDAMVPALALAMLIEHTIGKIAQASSHTDESFDVMRNYLSDLTDFAQSIYTNERELATATFQSE